MIKLSIVLIALAVIAPLRVELLPGQAVPVLCLILVATVAQCVALAVLLVRRARDVVRLLVGGENR